VKPQIIPQLWFLAGLICFLTGTLLGIRQTIQATEPANINCGADRP